MKRKLIWIHLFLLPFYFTGFPMLGQQWVLKQQIHPSDRNQSDFFGHSVDQNSQYMVIGSMYDKDGLLGDEEILGAGAAYVYGLTETGQWLFMQKITSPVRCNNQHFGTKVMLHEPWVFVSASKSRDGEGWVDGAVYVYRKNELGIFQYKQTLLPNSVYGAILFGRSMQVDDRFLIIGAPGDSYDAQDANYLLQAGAVYFFQLDNEGIWQKVQKLTSPSRTEKFMFGSSLGFSGNHLLISSPKADVEFNGSTYVQAGQVHRFLYERTGITYAWNQKALIQSPYPTNNDQFGYALAIDGQYAVISVLNEDENEDEIYPVTDAGGLYVYKIHAFTGAMNLDKKLVAFDRESGSNYGVNLSLDGDYLAVSAHEESKDAIGANPLSQAGAVYLYSKKSGSWSFFQKLTSPTRRESQQFGYSVNVFNDRLLTGSPKDSWDANGSNYISFSGSVAEYTYQAGSWIMNPAISERFNCYPNPVHDRLVIQNHENLQIDQIRLFDMQGRLVYEHSEPMLTNPVIDFTGFKPGLFILHIESNKHLYTQKVIR